MEELIQCELMGMVIREEEKEKGEVMVCVDTEEIGSI